MKYKIEFEGDYHEDFDELRRIAAFKVMDRAIYDALNIIRSRLKYCDDVPQDEHIILTRIRDALYIPEIDS